MIFLLSSLFLGFLVTLVGMPYARKYLISSGLFGVDQQKEEKPKLPSSGGIMVLFGFMVSITSYLALSTVVSLPEINIAVTMAALNSAVLIGLIGLLDDIHVNLEVVIREELDIEKDDFEFEIQEKLDVQHLPHQNLLGKLTGDFNGGKESEGVREGLGQIPKMMFVLPAALPLIAVGAGSWSMHLPLIGTVEWGLIYPFVLLPIGLFFVSNVINMLAGTNGLSAGMSLIASSALGTYSYMNGSIEGALIAFSLSASLLGFLRYNFYPASVLPGDVLPYLSGAAMFSTMVIANIEKFGVFIFIPWFAEFFLKLRSGFEARSWGKLLEDGTLDPHHQKTYSLTHPFMLMGLNERQITLALMAGEILICLTGLVLFTAVV